MCSEQLEVGDILLDGKHSGIFIGGDKDRHCIAHALSGGFHGANVRATSLQTFLKACNASTISIFRCTNRALAKKAAEYVAKFSASKDLAYDPVRLLQANNFADSLEKAVQQPGADRLAILHETFNLSGFIRAIKYASRRNIHLINSTDGYKHNRGMRCAFFVCICYQIAALESLVEAIPAGDAKQWVSNKHIDITLLPRLKSELSEEMYEKYITYLSKPRLGFAEKCLIQTDEAVRRPASRYPNSALKRAVKSDDRPHYQPALFQWKGNDHAVDEKRLTKAMMVDAKYCTALYLLRLLEEDQQSWIPLQNLSKKIVQDSENIHPNNVSIK